MLKRLLVTTSALIAPALASAADLPVRTTPPPPVLIAAPLSWSGPYVGLHAGVGYTSVETAIRGANFAQPDAVQFVTLAADVVALIPDGRWSSHDANGAVAGGQIGYNWQVAPSVVIGAELDWSWTGVDGSARCGVNNAYACRTETNWIASASARLGYTFDRAMLFAKAGVAYADMSYRSFLGVDPILDQDDKRVGFLLGAGVEYRLAPNWSAKLEYNYIDLGSETYRIRRFGPIACMGDCGSLRVEQTYQVVKVGLNYHFGGGSSGVLIR